MPAMFIRRQPQQPAITPNRFINRVITYGLIFFVAYILFTGFKSPQQNTNTVRRLLYNNYTPFDWDKVEFNKYVRIKNLKTGEEHIYPYSGQHLVQLGATAEKPEPAYEVEIIGKK